MQGRALVTTSGVTNFRQFPQSARLALPNLRPRSRRGDRDSGHHCVATVALCCALAAFVRTTSQTAGISIFENASSRGLCSATDYSQAAPVGHGQGIFCALRGAAMFIPDAPSMATCNVREASDSKSSGSMPALLATPPTPAPRLPRASPRPRSRGRTCRRRAPVPRAP